MWILLALLLLLLVGRIANPPGSQQSTYLIAQAIAKAEGFYAGNTLPRRMNNPGSITSGGQLVQYASEQDGWNALYALIERILSGESAYYTPDMSVLQVAHVYTGEDKPEAWARIVAEQLGVSVNEPFGNLPNLLRAA